MTVHDAKESRFLDLVKRVNACQKCARMKGSARVLGPGCGPLDAPLMFIGEAPGRLGADGSHLPFHGDKSGHNFESLIEQVGLSRYDVLVTNAVLCNPKDERGNNATPTAIEVSNCAPFLRESIDILSPAIVVTLGAVALRACSAVEAHSLALRNHVRSRQTWMGRTLIPMYHPGQRAMVHRSFANQLSDYQFVAESLQRLKKPRRRTGNAKPSVESVKLGQVARRTLRASPKGLSYFALHKLCFLAEIAALEETGERLTNSYVVRQKDGPYFVDLHLAKLQKLLPELQTWSERSRVMLGLPGQLGLPDGGEQFALSPTEAAIVDKVILKRGGMSDGELKRAVYMSRYMRALLRKEKRDGVNLYNAAVLPFSPKPA